MAEAEEVEQDKHALSKSLKEAETEVEEEVACEGCYELPLEERSPRRCRIATMGNAYRLIRRGRLEFLEADG